MIPPDRWDLAIAGTGPAGALTALLSARAGLRVALLASHAQRIPGNRFPETLSAAACARLRSLGLGEALTAATISECVALDVSWGGPPRSISGVGVVGGLGVHVDRRLLDERILASAVLSGVALFEPASLGAVLRTDSGWAVEADRDRPPVRARLLVDATGRASALAPRLGARRRTFGASIAVGCELPSRCTPRPRAVTVESTRTGWWYACPGVDGGMFVTFVTAPRSLPRARAARRAWWSEELAATSSIAPIVAPDHREPSLVTRAAGSALTEPASGDDWIAVGDAALSVEALSGSGFGVAIETAVGAARAGRAFVDGDQEALRKFGEDVASLQAAYARERLDHYAAERRWAAEPFWAARLEGGGD